MSHTFPLPSPAHVPLTLADSIQFPFLPLHDATSLPHCVVVIFVSSLSFPSSALCLHCPHTACYRTPSSSPFCFFTGYALSFDPIVFPLSDILLVYLHSALYLPLGCRITDVVALVRSYPCGSMWLVRYKCLLDLATAFPCKRYSEYILGCGASVPEERRPSSLRSGVRFLVPE
ncbi:hypothetical protein DFH06DRAFT_1242326 [Mycena polygramma]|nr:hypothetical protein DFH06DRAFT_1242326 [Mycena polygramma]